MANQYIHESVSKFARRAKQLLLIGGLAVLASCSSSSSDANLTVAEVRAKQVATLDDTRISLLESLAKLYPNGKLPADQQAAASQLLMQNPSVFRSSATGSNIKAQVFAGVTADFSPVYRIQNTTLYGSYFFTIYDSEKASALSLNPDWKLEGPAFYASPTAATDLSPVYRFRNKVNGSYVFSIYEAERNSINTSYADTFAEEGVAWYARQTPSEGFTELYRFRNKTNGTYLFTAYASEKQAIIDNYPEIFVYEGVAYYVQVTAAGAAFTGKVIDGYISGATVFWDCNGNNLLDTGEVFTISFAGGKYIIVDKTDVVGCNLLADIGVNAVDEDRPYVSGKTYTMRAAPGQKNLITPFSTLISGIISIEAGLTVDAAEARLASEIGSPGKLLFDYKAATTDPRATSLVTSAKVIADSLHQTQKNAFFDASLIATYNDIKTKFAESGFLANINLGIVPFVNAYQNISDRLSLLISGNFNNRMYRKTTFADAATNQFLDSLALEVNNRNAVKYGVVDWNLFSSTEKDVYIRRLNKLSGLQSDTTLQTQISSYQNKRSALFATASSEMNASIADDTDWVSFFTNDPKASMTFGMEMVSIAFDTSLDVIAIGGARPRTIVLTPKVWSYSNAQIKKQLEHLTFLMSATKCLLSTQAIADSDSNMLDKTVSLVADCGSFFADVAKDATQIAKTRRASEMASKMMTNAGVLNNVVGEKQKALLALKMYAAMVGTVHDAVGLFVKDPITTRVLAAFDLGIQHLNAAIAGMELEIAATEKSEVLVAAALLKYNQEVEKTWREYYFTYLTLVSNYYFEIVDSTLVQPIITDIAPLSATANQVVTFTVKGKYLPSTALLTVLDSASCTAPINNNLMGFTQTCTMGGSAGVKAITVKKASGGTVIDNTRTVNVTTVPVAANIDLPSTSYLRGTNVALSVNGYGADTLMNAPPYLDVPNGAEWYFVVPVTGSYQLFATYASEESRPSQISFNGTQVFANALASTTGGFFPANRQTLLQGIVQLTAGANTMRVYRSSAFPHIKGFSLVLVNSGVGLLNPANGHRYEVITCGAWNQCDAAARAKGGNLVTIRNSAENTWLLANIFNPSSNVMFIGLFKTGSTWSWSSGEPVAFTAWLPGNPDNYLGNQNYVHLSSGNLLWDDVADAFYGPATQAIVEYSNSGTLSVAANLSTGTQFTVPAGATSCTFNASGTWNNATSSYTAVGDVNTMPSQWPSYYTWPMSTSPFFSLIALKGGAPFYIGNQATLSVTSGQSISFVANDSYYSNSFAVDNTGALSVSYNCN